MSNFAWVTLTTNDTYSLGALVLAHSLRRTGTVHQLAVLVTPTVSEAMRSKLQDVYNVVQEVNVLDSQDAANLALLARPELGITFTKLHCWRLVQFEKCVFLDADTLVLQNCDELFEREELSAAPDVSWPDCFNSGVFVYKPNLDTFAKIAEFAAQNGSFDGGDQGLLNSYFADWAQSDAKKRLPFIYNVAAFASYCYLPAFKQFRDKIKILHFAGKLKPWLVQFNSENRTACTPSDYAHAADLIQLWWNIFCDNVHQNLTDNMAGLAGALSQLRLGAQRTPEQEAYEQLMRRQCWESGQIDYAGRDSFDNIWRKITETLENKPAPSEPKEEDKSDLLSRINHLLHQNVESLEQQQRQEFFDTRSAATRAKAKTNASTATQAVVAASAPAAASTTASAVPNAKLTSTAGATANAIATPTTNATANPTANAKSNITVTKTTNTNVTPIATKTPLTTATNTNASPPVNLIKTSTNVQIVQQPQKTSPTQQQFVVTTQQPQKSQITPQNFQVTTQQPQRKQQLPQPQIQPQPQSQAPKAPPRQHPRSARAQQQAQVIVSTTSSSANKQINVKPNRKSK